MEACVGHVLCTVGKLSSSQFYLVPPCLYPLHWTSRKTHEDSEKSFFCFVCVLFVRMWAARVPKAEPKLPDLQVQRGELSEAVPGRWSSRSRCRMPESERRTGLRIRRRRGGFRWTSQPRLEPCRRRPDAITEFERMRFCAGSSRTLRREIGRDEQDPIGCGER